MGRARVWLIVSAALVFVLFLTRYKVQTDIKAALRNKNVRAFLETIGKFESNGRYDVVYGGRTFSDFSQHPKIRTPFVDPRTGKQNYSTAAGKYQITYPTWLSIQGVEIMPDFSPESQDYAAVVLLNIRGALGFVIDGDFENAIRVASKTWASLPYTDSKQNHVSVSVAQNEYIKNGGQLA